MGVCFKYPPPGTICSGGGDQCDVCGQPFSDVYEFNATTTEGRQPGCFTGVGIAAGAQSEATAIANGWWCGWGCTGIQGDEASCDDSAFATAGNPLDGKRWLTPIIDVFASGRDAFGMIHDLRSNEYHPVPPVTRWYRGTCWYNDGRECFGDDVCGCWRKGTTGVAAGDVGCMPGNVPVGSPVGQILPDVLFRAGFHWGDPGAYLVGANDLGPGAYYCRRFDDTRKGIADPREEPGSVTLAAGFQGGLIRIAEGMLEPIGASYSQFQGNLLVYCAANLVKPPVDCLTSIWYQYEDAANAHYNESPNRWRFNRLELDITTDPPRIDAGPEPTDFQQAVVDAKNTILRAILGKTFDATTFDRVDHMQPHWGNRALGYYERTWFGDHVIPGVYGACRLAQSGCAVTCELHVRTIKLAAYVVLEHLRSTQQSLIPDRQMEPHLRFQVIIELETTATAPEPCAMRKWDGTLQPLLLNGLAVEPDIDWIEFRDPSDRPFKPPSMVEWFGFLGEHSRPRARDYRENVGSANVADRVADVIEHIPIPGWPMLAESAPETPQGTYKGTVFVSYPQ